MPKRNVRINPSPNAVQDVSDYRWKNWFAELRERVGEGPLRIQGYLVASLPDPTMWGSLSTEDPFSSLIFIADESGGPTLAYSNGTNWLRTSDGAIVS